MTYLLLVPLLSIVAFLLFIFYQFFIKIYIDAARFLKMDPSLKTFITPFSGLIGLQRRNIELYGDSHKFVKDMIKQNPQQKAYLTNFGHRPFLILCDPKLIKELSLNPKKFKKNNLFKHSDKAYTKGIFFVEDEDWTAERAIIRHAFTHQQLQAMIPAINQSIDHFIAEIKKEFEDEAIKKRGRVFKVVHQSELLIGQIFIHAFFAMENTKMLGDRNLSTALADFTTTMFNRSRTGQSVFFSLLFGSAATRMNFSKQDKQLEVLITEIRKQLMKVVEDKSKKIAENSENSKDFLSFYIRQKKEIDAQIEEHQKNNTQHKLRRISNQEIIHQLISFYFAGIDTTGHLVAMALYALAQYHQHRKTIIQQIKRTIPNQAPCSYQNLQKLVFMGNFLDECLRMWPPAVGVLSRVTRERIQIGPFDIPPNTCVGTNIIGLMHNQKYYQKPQHFNPYRWEGKGLHSSEPYAFIPFSAGSRSCIGKYLALMEAKLILIKMLAAFDFSRTQVPLRLHAKFLYQPIDQDLLLLHKGGYLQL